VLNDGRFTGLLRDLSGRTDKDLAALVVDQLHAAGAGIRIALDASCGALPTTDARAAMVEAEHDGDDRRAALVTRLQESLTSPMDREDMFRLSRSIDDILDELRDFVRELDLFDTGPHEAYTRMLRLLEASVDHLVEAVELLPTAPRRAAERARQAKKPGVRGSYQNALADLLALPLTAHTVKVTLLLRCLDQAGANLAAAADALADGVMKRFQ
jgi:uncharacterized protein